MSALFWLVVRWVAAALIGVAAGSAAAVLGLARVALSIGAVALLIGAVYVFASILVTNTSVVSRRGSSDGADIDLVGAGLLRATFLGFLGAGAVVGSATGDETTLFIALVTGASAILLSLRFGPPEERGL